MNIAQRAASRFERQKWLTIKSHTVQIRISSAPKWNRKLNVNVPEMWCRFEVFMYSLNSFTILCAYFEYRKVCLFDSNAMKKMIFDQVDQIQLVCCGFVLLSRSPSHLYHELVLNCVCTRACSTWKFHAHIYPFYWNKPFWCSVTKIISTCTPEIVFWFFFIHHEKEIQCWYIYFV